MKRLPVILLVLAVAVFAAGLLHLFHLRFEAGDIYPEYSSLRADPLGTKAFYQSLERLLPVSRNYKTSLDLGESRGASLFVLGLEPKELRAGPDELKQLEGFVAGGGRMVIALAPRFQDPAAPWWERAARSKTTNSPPSAQSKQTNSPSSKAEKKPSPGGRKRLFMDDEETSDSGQTKLGERWKFELKYARAAQDENGVYRETTVERQAGEALPESLEWHSAAWFDRTNRADAVWRVIYAREKDRPVAMERRLGGGTIVLLTDSFHFSNEALRLGRHADLLAWLVGPARRVIFDEAHLGVQEDAGVATLARKYRLHGLFLALLVLAALFIWKHSVSFMPAGVNETALAQDDHVLGRHSVAGFVNLLRRNLRVADLPATCLHEWKKSCGRSVPQARLQEIEALVGSETQRPARERDPVKLYQTVSRLLSKPRF